MKVAVFGCIHGMFDDMFAEVFEHEQRSGEKIDFIVVSGDCQTMRHPDDLQCLACPDKYKRLGDFSNYYNGIKKVPKLTIFVGGNHECSNYLMTLPYGGWVCESVYYMGLAGVVRYKGLRIAGVSGIFNQSNCNRGRYERMPMTPETIRSIYHMRKLDTFKLQLLQKRISKHPIDLFLSHDWPTRIYDYGNKQQLLRFKPAFRQDMDSRQGLGNPMTRPLVFQLKPRRWLAAHLHCRFHARVRHRDQPSEVGEEQVTEFLSLDKIENKYKNSRFRNYMDVIDIEPLTKLQSEINHDDNLYFDIEWLTIIRKTQTLDRYCYNNIFTPRLDEAAGQAFYPTDQDIDQTRSMMENTGGLKIDPTFKMVEPVIYNRPGNVQPSLDAQRRLTHSNYQTENLCQRLSIKIPEYLRIPGQDHEQQQFKSDTTMHFKAEKREPSPEVRFDDSPEPAIDIKKEPKYEKSTTYN